MKRLIVLLLTIGIMLFMAGCGEGSFPPEVTEYAKKHEMEMLSPGKLQAKAIVGKNYVVYGTVSSISFSNYKKGSSDLKQIVSNASEKMKDLVEAELKDTMSYYVYLSGLSTSLKYDDWNFPSRMLNINKGDEVAFIVSCEDGYLQGTYDYIIKEKIWESRHSETTIEEDHDAQEKEN